MRKTLAVFVALVLSTFSIPVSAQTSSSLPTAQSSPTLVNGWVVAGSHTLVGFNAVVNAPAGGYILAFDATAIPADGPVTPGGCYVVNPTPAGFPASETSMANTPLPIPVSNGIVLVFSTTGCLTLTKSATMWLTVLLQ